MSAHSRHGATGKPISASKLETGSAAAGHGNDSVPRVRSHELLRDGEQLIIEHAGREYRLRVTSNGKLILTA